MNKQEKSCCSFQKKRGVFSGLIFGLLPHSFCILFIVFSVIGAVAFSGFLKKFLLIPNFFFFLVAASFLMSTISLAIYLKKNDCLCRAGIKSRWRYISMLYATTILTNLLMFFVVFPAVANMENKKNAGAKGEFSKLSLAVDIPCSGHAPLIIEEIKKNSPVQSVTFEAPGKFIISYDPEKTTPKNIESLDIFKTFPAKTI